MSKSKSHLNIQVVHGTEKYDISLSNNEHSDLRVADLACEVEKVTGVPLHNQKLIYRGRCLQEHAATLTSVGISNSKNCKIMLVGQKVDVEDAENSKAIADVSAAVDKLEEQVQDLKSRLEGIEKGYLDKQLHSEALIQVDKQLQHTCEYLVRHMEQLDALSLSPTIRIQRRSLLTRIQGLLSVCDNLREKVALMKTKL